MNSVVFREWFENQLMPALKNPSLVKLDNASYHNVKKTLNRSRQLNPHFPYLHAKKSNACPLPEGIFGASDPSFGSHI
jgi:transposase